MIALLILLLVWPVTWLEAQQGPAANAGAPTLQLPDVTLLAEDTVFLSAPPPKGAGLPGAAGLRENRYSFPRPTLALLIARPDPPRTWQIDLPPALVAVPGLFPAVPEPESRPGAAAAAIRSDAAGPGGWQAAIDYLASREVRTDLLLERSRSVWDTSASLDLVLADGWLAPDPVSTSHLGFGLEAVRNDLPLRLEAAGRGRAVFPASGQPLYTLQAGGLLEARWAHTRLLQSTRLYGLSRADTGQQIGLVEQELAVELWGARVGLCSRGRAILRAERPADAMAAQGTAEAVLAVLPPHLPLELRGGAALLAYDGAVRVYPSGRVELFPSDILSLSLQASPFLLPPPDPDVQAILGAPGLLEVQGGYSIACRLLLDQAAAFSFGASFEWRSGVFYRFRDQELFFEREQTGQLGAELSWQVLRALPGRPGLKILALGEAGWPISAGASFLSRLSSYLAGIEMKLHFYKFPVEFIMEALSGNFIDDGSGPFLFEDFTVFTGEAASFEAIWTIGARQLLRTGVEVFFPGARGWPDTPYRFLIGYGIRG